MGTCVYCGEPAGLFRSRHADCAEKHEIAAQKIPEFFTQYLTSPLPARRFRELAEEVARTHYLGKVEFRALVIKGMSQLVDTALSDHLFTEAEERRVDELRDEFGLTAGDLGETAVKFIKAAILRDLDEGRVPHRINFQESSPIALRRGETVIWIFNGVSYHVVGNRIQYVGGSHGVSFRIMKGVYYRVGAHKGERIQTPYLFEEGRGDLVVTERAVYFISPAHVVKISATRIVSIKPYIDGIEITRDAANAKPQFFLLEDAWFAANLISRLNQIEGKGSH